MNVRKLSVLHVENIFIPCIGIVSEKLFYTDSYEKVCNTNGLK